MNQITTTQAPINLPAAQKDLVNLRVGNKAVKDLSTPELKRALVKILTKASFDMGSPMADDPKVLQFQTEACFMELKKPFDSLTLPEVEEAFKRGIRGESGPYFGMCPKTYHQFLKWFWDLPERGQSWLAYLDSISVPQLPTVDKTIFSNEGIKKAFDRYKQSEVMPFGAFAYYDLLNEKAGVDFNGIKTLVTDPQVRKEAVERSKREYEQEMKKAKKSATNRCAFNQAEAITASLAAEGKEDNILPNIIKREFLREYFKKLIAEGKELTL